MSVCQLGNTGVDTHTLFSSGNSDDQICLQQEQQQVQETPTYQVADGLISVRTVIDKLLFIQASYHCQLENKTELVVKLDHTMYDKNGFTLCLHVQVLS